MRSGRTALNRARVRRHLVLAILVIYALCFQVFPNIPRGQLLAFGTFMASGRAVSLGLSPYTPNIDIYNAVGSGDYSPNLNPPVSLLLFQHLAWIKPQAGFRIWVLTSFLLYLLALVLVCRTYPKQVTLLKVIWALSFVGLWATLREGQDYMPLALMAVGAWLLLKRGRNVGAGIVIGLLVAVKPNFAVWLALLLFGGYWMAALAGAVTTAAISLLPVFTYGPGVYLDWLRVLPHGEARASPVNSSLTGFATRIGVAWTGELASGALLLALAWWAWRRKPDALQLSGVALVAAMLASPLSWMHYSVLLLPVLFSRSWTPAWWAVAVLLLTPDYLLWNVAFNHPEYIWEAGLIGTTALALLLGTLLQPWLPAWARRATGPMPQSRPSLSAST